MSGTNSSARAFTDRPAEGVALTVHSLPDPGRADARRTRSGRIKMLLVLLVCASPVIASYLAFFFYRPDAGANYSELIVPARAAPPAAALPLADLQGRPVDPASLQAQWLLVVVGDGRCDAACERALVLQRQLRETLGRERERVDKIWFVTDDAPLRPEVLAGIGKDTTVLRVPAAAIAAWLEPAPGQAIGAHLYLVDPMGRWMLRAPPDPDPGKLKRDLERLLRAAVSWDRPGR
ncbi:MAG: hypothetical protein KA151_01390 [Piscinibacter sp.]|nr:hypothetical protein [Piscinibacter sp.]